MNFELYHTIHEKIIIFKDIHQIKKYENVNNVVSKRWAGILNIQNTDEEVNF